MHNGLKCWVISHQSCQFVFGYCQTLRLHWYFTQKATETDGERRLNVPTKTGSRGVMSYLITSASSGMPAGKQGSLEIFNNRNEEGLAGISVEQHLLQLLSSNSEIDPFIFCLSAATGQRPLHELGFYVPSTIR